MAFNYAVILYMDFTPYGIVFIRSISQNDQNVQGFISRLCFVINKIAHHVIKSFGTATLYGPITILSQQMTHRSPKTM